MTESYIDNSSFKFGGVEMYDQFGIRVIESSDLLLPELRARKVTIPSRSGSYDYGAIYHNERLLKLRCQTISTVGRDEIREISYVLSKKSAIRVWDEPGKYYIGRIYSATDLEKIRQAATEFTLIFTCDPYAYGNIVQMDFGMKLKPNYIATRMTPTQITIRNTGSVDAVGIHVTLINRKES